jgi:hypothetical protein
MTVERAAHVVTDHPSERVQLRGQRGDERMLPLQLETTVEAVDPQDVDRTVPRHVVRDVDAIGRDRVPRIGNVHQATTR